MRYSGTESVADVLGALIGVAFGSIAALAWVACSSEDPRPNPPRDAAAEMGVDAGKDAKPAEATRPPHDVTPVCADDAAGCDKLDAESRACPPWCPEGNQPPNRNM